MLAMPPKEGLELIKQAEGIRLDPYRDCAGIPTIGIGSTRDSLGNPVTMGTPSISIHTAYDLLARDASKAWVGINSLFRGVALEDHQLAALLDFAYNLGLGALQRSTLRQELLRGESPPMQSWTVWCLAGRPLRRSAGLYARRLREYQMFSSS